MKQLEEIQKTIDRLKEENKNLRQNITRLETEYNKMVARCNEMSNDLIKHQMAIKHIKEEVSCL
jgi:predicted nuclease with TOPRIM domain